MLTHEGKTKIVQRLGNTRLVICGAVLIGLKPFSGMVESLPRIILLIRRTFCRITCNVAIVIITIIRWVTCNTIGYNNNHQMGDMQ